DSAGLDAVLGKLIPIASIAEAIVLAVYIPPNEPAPGHALHSSSFTSHPLISPLFNCPTPSKTETKSMSFPFNLPGDIVPPYTKIPGTSDLAIEIVQPGMFLSHPPIVTTASILSAPTTVSIESAMTSLLDNENFIPSVPIEMPSDTVIVLKIIGTPPA